MATPQWQPLPRDYDAERKKMSVPPIKEAYGPTQHPLLPAPPKIQKSVVAETKPPPVPTSNAEPNTSVPPPPVPTPAPAPARRTSMVRKVASVSLTSDPFADVSPLGGGAAAGASLDPLADPLSSMSIASQAVDPLSSNATPSMLSKMKAAEEVKGVEEDNQKGKLNKSWEAHRAHILSTYSISGSIAIGADAYNEFAGSGLEEGNSFRAIDKHTARLAQLERAQSITSPKVLTMSQGEYIDHVKKLSTDLDIAWARDERVQSLKLAIQIAKLLSDTTVPKFYPTVFVIVIEALEKFGQMVFKRLVTRAEECLNDDSSFRGKRITLVENFTTADVPVGAKETCRNWFYKIACIRELLPRLLIEITLLKCYRFICDGEIPTILSRLASVARGIGDPLVSLYTRTALTVFASDLITDKQFLLNTVVDQITVLKMLQTNAHKERLKNWGLSHSEYVSVMPPGLDWLMKAVARNATKEIFQTVLTSYRDNSNDAMVLNSIMEAFDGTYYAHASLGMVALIKNATPSSSTVVDLFATLGKQLLIHPPPEDQKIPLLNDIWRVVAKCDDISTYILCASVWLEMTYKHYSEREVMILLGDLTPRFHGKIPDLSDKVLRQFEVVINILIAGSNISLRNAVLQSDHLLKILDVFKGNRKIEISKEVMLQFRSNWKASDASLINTLFEIGRTLHDSVDSLSPIGERKQIAALLNGFIEKIDFGRDLEQQLNTYVESRAIFCNLDDVKDKLIQCVGHLAVKACKLMKAKHNKKTAAFTKACLAYCHITIPSIGDTRRKLELLLFCSQVALLNQCLPQTDAFLKSAISLIPEVPASEETDGKRIHSEEKLAVFVKSLLSTLILVPGHPEHGPFYIVQGLLNALPRYPWQPHTGVQTRTYTEMLGLLCSFAQRKFIYRITYVESNDSLYGGAEEYMLELTRLINTCVEEIIKQLTTMGERSDASAKVSQARMIFDLANQISARMDISQEVGVFLVRLLDLASKSKAAFTRPDTRYFLNTIEFVQLRVARSHPELSEAVDRALNALKAV